jgi:iron complex transport system substrate-binding protein
MNVVSLAPGTSELASLTGVPLKGRTDADTYPVTITHLPIVVKNTHPDFEKIASLKADLAIYDEDLTSAADLQKLKDMGIPTAGVGGSTVEEYIKSMYRLAAKAGTESLVNDNVKQIYKAIETAKADPLSPKPKVAILLPFANSNPMIAGTKSFYADLVRQAGAEPVGPDATKFVTIGIEQLTQLNPDAIVVGGEKGDFSELTKSPLLANLRAVKTGKYMGLDPSILERRGTRCDQAISKMHNGFKTLFH